MKHYNNLCLIAVVVVIGLYVCCQNDQGSTGRIKVQNLEAFARLYGYVRFFHPSDEASGINWDKFAIYGAGRVAETKDSDELKMVLEELFLPIGPTVQIYRSGQKPEDFLKSISDDLPEDKSSLKVVAWQHRGVGLGGSFQIYSSVRINRENEMAAPEKLI